MEIVNSVLRVRASDALRRRFATRYRGRHHPDDALDWLIEPRSPSRRGTPPPPLPPNPSAVYRREFAGGVNAPALAVLIAEAQHRLEQDRLDAEDAVAEVIDASRARRRRAAICALVAVVAVAASAAFVTARQTVAGGALRTEAAAAVVGGLGREAPEQFFSRFPDRLASGWSHHPPTSAVELDGARTVTVPLRSRATRVLVFVACAGADRSYEYKITAAQVTAFAAHGYGACGTLRGIEVAAPPDATTLRVLVVTRGIDPFSLSVYTR